MGVGALSSADREGLSDPFADRGACGVGVLVQLDGTASHQLVEDALDVLVNIDHRGARGAEEMTGDGAGLMIQVPHEFFAAEVAGLGEAGTYGVGMAFLPKDHWTADEAKRLVERVAVERGFRFIAWRAVPTDSTGLGKAALDSEPRLKQFFVKPEGDEVSAEALDVRLYLLRRAIERAMEEVGIGGWGRDIFYVCSLDRRTVVYKGLLTCDQVRSYFPDLSDPRMKTAIVLLHSRFSTNTLGAWQLAHPFRAAVHNGEINTLRGNLNRMRTREAALESELFGDDIRLVKPVVQAKGSDTSAFDNVLELLVKGGRSLPHALRLLIPEAWSKDAGMPEGRRTFYDYLSTISEPWDGPALVAATDGTRVAAALDRNGLRPCRYVVTTGGRLIMASELGVLETPESEIVLSGRLKPGQIFVADTELGRVLGEDEVFAELARPEYGEWLAAGRVRLPDVVDDSFHAKARRCEGVENIEDLQRVFGYTVETLRVLVQPMAELGKDPTGAMGNDAPPAFLSGRQKPLSSYFSQLFAQVSNPPLDYMREDLVTSLESHIGRQRNLLGETAEHCRQLWLRSPFLTAEELAAISGMDPERWNGIQATTLDLTYEVGMSLGQAITKLRAAAARAIGEGFEILILSDRAVGAGRLPIPALLAVGGLNHFLIREGLRTKAALVVDTGEAASVHSFCTLIGYGADAVHPWLADASLAKMREDGVLAGNCRRWWGSITRRWRGGFSR